MKIETIIMSMPHPIAPINVDITKEVQVEVTAPTKDGIPNGPGFLRF